MCTSGTPLQPPSGSNLVLSCRFIVRRSVITLGDCTVIEGVAGIVPVRLSLILLPWLQDHPETQGSKLVASVVPNIDF